MRDASLSTEEAGKLPPVHPHPPKRASGTGHARHGKAAASHTIMPTAWATDLSEALQALEQSNTGRHTHVTAWTPEPKHKLGHKKDKRHSPTKAQLRKQQPALGGKVATRPWVESRESNLMDAVPPSLHAPAPFSTHMPGGKVKPAPHNLGALQRNDGTNKIMAETSATNVTHLPNVSSHLVVGSQVVGPQGTHLASWSSASMAQHMRSTSNPASRTAPRGSGYAATGSARQVTAMSRDAVPADGLQQSSDQQLPGQTGMPHAVYITTSQHGKGKVLQSSTQLQHSWPREEVRQGNDLTHPAASTWPVQDRDQPGWKQTRQQQQQQRYPAFVYAMVPLAKPLPAVRSNVRRKPAAQPTPSHWQHASAHDEHLAGVDPHAAAVHLANQRIAAADGAAATYSGNASGHPTSALLCALISNQAPTIDAGRGLTGHLAALRAQQAAKAMQDSVMSPAAVIAMQSKVQTGSHTSLTVTAELPPVSPEPPVHALLMLQQPKDQQPKQQLGTALTAGCAANAASTHADVSLATVLPATDDNLQHAEEMPAECTGLATAAPGLQCDVSAAGWAATGDAINTSPDPRAQAVDELLMQPSQAQYAAAGSPAQELLLTAGSPTAGQTLEQSLAMAAQAEGVLEQQPKTKLALQLDEVVADLEQDLSSPVDAADLVLKTRHTHHKIGPLPHLQPLLSTYPHTLLSPAAAIAGAPTIDLPGSIANTPSPGATSDTPGRTPMFTRRASYNTAGSPSFRAMSATPEADSQQGGGQSLVHAMELRLSQKIAVDVDAAHLEATRRLEQAQAAAEAAAAAAAAAATQAQAQAANIVRPPTRQGLAESVAVVGAALASAAAQAGTPKTRDGSRHSMSLGLGSATDRSPQPVEVAQAASSSKHGDLAVQETSAHAESWQSLVVQDDIAAPALPGAHLDTVEELAGHGPDGDITSIKRSVSQEIDMLLHDIVSSLPERLGSTSAESDHTHTQALAAAGAGSSGDGTLQQPCTTVMTQPFEFTSPPMAKRMAGASATARTIDISVPAVSDTEIAQASDQTAEGEDPPLRAQAAGHAGMNAADVQAAQLPVHPFSAPVGYSRKHGGSSCVEATADEPGFSTITVEVTPDVDVYHGHVYQPPAAAAGHVRASFATDLVQDAGVKPPSRAAGVYRQASSVAGYSGPSSYYPDDADTDYDLDMEDTRSSSRTYAEASAARLGHRSTYNSLPGSDGGDGMASEDGEVLSVSAYGITAAQSLLNRSSRQHASEPGLPPSMNDVVEGGVRLLGQRYEVLSVVGEGAYGMVMKCRVRGSDPEKWVAVKEFKITDDDPDAEDVKRTSRREVSLLRMLQHPHVVAHLDDFLVRDRLFIVMEFVPCNLLELLEAQPGGMDRQAVRLILYQLCTAIAYIHSQGVIYRDIKPENLLVDEQGRLKLCDFGFARPWANGPEDALTDYVATRWYRAPELLLGPPYTSKDNKTIQSRYDAAIDIWAIGCLMGELIEGEPLFPGDSDLDQLYRIQTVLGPITKQQHQLFCRNPANLGIAFNIKDPMTLASRYEGVLNDDELSFMSGLLTMDPSQRMTGMQCLQHPYLKHLWEADQLAGGEYQPTSLLRFTPRTTQDPAADAACHEAGSVAEDDDNTCTLDPALAALMDM